jgi:hypothetical protein
MGIVVCLQYRLDVSSRNGSHNTIMIQIANSEIFSPI